MTYSIVVMSMEIVSKLVVESQSLSSTMLTSLFRVSHFCTWSVGDKIIRPRQILFRDRNGLSIKSGMGKGKSLKEHLEALMGKLARVNFDRLTKSVRNGYQAEFRIGVDCKSKKGKYIFSLPIDFLAVADRIGATIDIDILYLIEDRQDAGSVDCYDTKVHVTYWDKDNSKVSFETESVNAFDLAMDRFCSVQGVTLFAGKEVVFCIEGDSPVINLSSKFISTMVDQQVGVKLIAVPNSMIFLPMP